MFSAPSPKLILIKPLPAHYGHDRNRYGNHAKLKQMSGQREIIFQHSTCHVRKHTVCTSI